MDYRIFPPEELPEAIIDLPLSKSISNRVLIINALAGGAGMVTRVAKCDDTDVMLAALGSSDDTVSIGAAGTAMRFLTAYFAATPGRTVTLDGSDRMRRRPIAPLVDALRMCGAHIEYAGEEGYPPLRIEGTTLAGGEIELDGGVSSQFVSALLMVAPTMSGGLKLHIKGDVVSQPYISMTLGIMAEWGVEAQREGNVITVPHASYTPVAYAVEADWSAASYWYELQSFSFGTIGLRGLKKNGSMQGDSALRDIYRSFGIVTEESDEFAGVLDLMADPDLTPRFEADFSAVPDIAQTVAVSCCLLGIPFHITGLKTLKIKETDRLEALRRELMKISFVVDIDDSSIAWEGARCPVDGNSPVAIDTYDDHRMAMSFAPVAWYVPGLIIRNAEVVTKSYPDYWNHLRSAGFVIEEISVVEGAE
ncbi:MAG: 3-phosphoshikimate 1-carboxyvinyltransferase [Muribaculum intestinale]|nr:3-phosphoshikimate 1-carboxyvinyltransferase [Muribaculum intestinale]